MPDEVSGGRRRRIHSDEFKAQLVASCSVPGVSTSAVAMAQGINPNLARRWVQAAKRRDDGVPAKAFAKSKPMPKPSAFVPVQLAGPVPASLPDKFEANSSAASVLVAPADIRVELRRGPLAISVSWPSAAGSQCAAWLTELLR
ncbi:MAG: transposase [Paucibacter sp.]|nr:transposase [Roseateles sp.]